MGRLILMDLLTIALEACQCKSNPNRSLQLPGRRRRS